MFDRSHAAAEIRRAFARSLKMVAVLSLACAGATGCKSKLGPGDFYVYHVSFGQAQQSDSCFNGMPPTTTHTSDIRQAATFYVYGSADGTVWLDAEKATLAGDVTDNGYQFKGSTQDVMPLGGGGQCMTFACNGNDQCACTGIKATGKACCDLTQAPNCMNAPDCTTQCCSGGGGTAGTTITSTDALKVDMALEGKLVNGKETEHKTTQCDGGACANFMAVDCTTETEFVGTQVDKVDLRHDL